MQRLGSLGEDLKLLELLRAVLRHAVLCHAVLYCTVLCYIVLCRAVLCRTALCCAVLHWAMLHHTAPCRAVPCRIVLRSPTWQSLKGPASIPWWLQHAVPAQSQLLLAREEQHTSPEHLCIPG